MLFQEFLQQYKYATCRTINLGRKEMLKELVTVTALLYLAA
jgi:hypothetical protein